ncbi:MAG TPA: cyclic nucleotide-binding domain-containing protein [Solirubrobacteraceae bacterium]|nr:cyclic nucleotide-binding domain-containing protein [Solirubrobacteraceae bacterium]
MGQRGAVLRRVVGNEALRRVEAAFLGFGCGENGVWVAILVYAYERGGTSLAAAIAVIQLLPAAAVAPFASRLTDRRGGAIGLWLGYVAQALSIGATAALLLAGAPSVAVYAAAVLAACAVTFTRPAQAALLPTLVEDPAELTSANALAGWLESASFLVGPGLAGVLIAVDGPGLACAAFAVGVALSALVVTPLARRVSTAPASPTTAPAAKTDGEVPMSVLTAVRSQPGMASLLGVVGVQFVALGALDVLEVVIAISLLALGPSGAGYLSAAFGAGGVAGGVLAIVLIRPHRLARPLLVGGLAWGAAFLLLSAWPTAAAAFALLAGAGACRTVLDVSGRTLLQRTIPAPFRGRVFGVLEGASMLGFALGSASVPLLAYLGGPRAAVAGTGVVLLAAVAATAHPVARLEASVPVADTALALLRGSSIFGMLPAPELEALAQSLVREQAPAGAAIVREGDRGDRFYLIASGTLTVSVGEAEIGALGPGDGFGEIALLRDGVRTATVTAREPVTLYALERLAFLEALTGSAPAHHAAQRLVADLLGGDAEPLEMLPGV